MKKLKKYQRVELFLKDLMKNGELDMQGLVQLKHKDISSAEELIGIGNRTIINVINAFKLDLGIIPAGKDKTKKKVVEEYLKNKIESGEISTETLLEMTYKDLKSIDVLKNVGKTTITCTLSKFKKKFDTQSFEDGVLDFLAQETTDEPVQETVVPQAKKRNSVKNSVVHHKFEEDIQYSFEKEDILLLRKMIRSFKQKGTVQDEKRNYELRELKHALLHFGINPNKILKLYLKEKDVSSQPMLSNSMFSKQVQKPKTLSLMQVG